MAVLGSTRNDAYLVVVGKARRHLVVVQTAVHDIVEKQIRQRWIARGI